MKQRIFAAASIGLVGLALSAIAYADSYSSEFVISKLTNNVSVTLTNDTLNVYSASGAMYNPGGCSDSSFAVVHPSVSAAGKELMGRMLTAAFLAGRKVKLRISSTSCSGGNPNYTAVQLGS